MNDQTDTRNALTAMARREHERAAKLYVNPRGQNLWKTADRDAQTLFDAVCSLEDLTLEVCDARHNAGLAYLVGGTVGMVGVWAVLISAFC